MYHERDAVTKCTAKKGRGSSFSRESPSLSESHVQDQYETTVGLVGAEEEVWSGGQSEMMAAAMEPCGHNLLSWCLG